MAHAEDSYEIAERIFGQVRSQIGNVETGGVLRKGKLPPLRSFTTPFK
jgi:hypothetical protein